MSCNCKSGVGPTLNEEIKEKGEKQVIGGYIARLIIFLLSLLLLPVILIFSVYFMFRTIVLNYELNIKEMFGGILKVMKRANSDYDYEDEEDDDDDEEYFQSLTEDDVILYDVEDLTEKN
jgi:hypothetical protein